MARLIVGVLFLILGVAACVVGMITGSTASAAVGLGVAVGGSILVSRS